MRPLELDLIRRPRPWLAWALLALALFITVDVGSAWLEARRALADGGRRAEERKRAPVEAPLSEQLQRELDNARRILLDLALPWQALFRSVESAAGEHTAVLTIEPEAGRGQVRITGEARNYLEALNFIVRLEEDKVLERVHLISHEVREDDPDHPYHFAVMGAWRVAP